MSGDLFTAVEASRPVAMGGLGVPRSRVYRWRHRDMLRPVGFTDDDRPLYGRDALLALNFYAERDPRATAS